MKAVLGFLKPNIWKIFLFLIIPSFYVRFGFVVCSPCDPTLPCGACNQPFAPIPLPLAIFSYISFKQNILMSLINGIPVAYLISCTIYFLFKKIKGYLSTKTSKEQLFIIIAILTILLMMFLALFFYLQSRSRIGTTTITPLKTPDTSSQFNETVYTDAGSANWKTYQGDGYSLKYPPTWSIVSPGDLRVQDKVVRVFSAHRESLIFTGNFNDWCTQEPTCAGYLSGIKKKNINGVDAYQYVNTNEKTIKLPGSWIYIPHDSSIYQVSWGIWPQDPSNYKFGDLVKEFNDPTFDQILSTFKFLDSGLSPKSQADCPSGTNFNVIGPLIKDQPPKTACVPEGYAVPN